MKRDSVFYMTVARVGYEAMRALVDEYPSGPFDRAGEVGSEGFVAWGHLSPSMRERLTMAAGTYGWEGVMRTVPLPPDSGWQWKEGGENGSILDMLASTFKRAVDEKIAEMDAADPDDAEPSMSNILREFAAFRTTLKDAAERGILSVEDTALAIELGLLPKPAAEKPKRRR